MEAKPQRQAKCAFRTRNAKRKERKAEKKTEFKNRKENTICTCGWFLRHALRSSAKRPRAIPPDIAPLSLSLSLSPYRLALFTRSAKAHTKLPRPSSHASAAPHTLKSRSQFYVPKIPTNWGELSAILTPRTIPEIQVPIRCAENSNQLGRSACHFDTPDNTRTPGPNSRSRNFQPTGESCPPFWHPGQ